METAKVQGALKTETRSGEKKGVPALRSRREGATVGRGTGGGEKSTAWWWHCVWGKWKIKKLGRQIKKTPNLNLRFTLRGVTHCLGRSQARMPRYGKRARKESKSKEVTTVGGYKRREENNPTSRKFLVARAGKALLMGKRVNHL